jgi:hypothetical protein
MKRGEGSKLPMLRSKNLLTWGRGAQIREQMSGPDLHVFTLKFLALKKPGFPP